ncbi:hypothetical protein ACFFX0_11990 [Citricoccus parietis]|uniref:Uncharacterized protein n=1 Tax=Citricoccus parietis TaxID=592307 RepID=A0ABV5FZQ0_9MICC
MIRESLQTQHWRQPWSGPAPWRVRARRGRASPGPPPARPRSCRGR